MVEPHWFTTLSPEIGPLGNPQIRRGAAVPQAEGNAGKIIRQLTQMDCVIIDELGYIPFPKSGGRFHSFAAVPPHQ